jgi:hypothetical protein
MARIFEPQMGYVCPTNKNYNKILFKIKKKLIKKIHGVTSHPPLP